MAQGKTSVSLWQDLFQVGVYKRNQGRVTRQVTFAVLFVALLLGAWRLWSQLDRASAMVQLGAPVGLLLIGTWISYRIVNYPQFADFLIAVEAEMAKVSWPRRTELFRASLVVIFVIFALAVLLFGFDLFWQMFFQAIGVLRPQGGP